MQAHAGGSGFGLLSRTAVFPHFDARGPEAARKQSAAHPDQLAIGIDNETAVIVKGNQIDVVGLGMGRSRPNVVVLRPGERYDLAPRRAQK